jgi:hypothetical protein
MWTSGVAISKEHSHRSSRRSLAIIGVILVSLAPGFTVGVAVTTALDERHSLPSISERSDSHPVDPIPRQEVIVESIAEAARIGCSVVLKIAEAPRREGFRFRRATRVLAHGFASFHELDRVTSRVIGSDGRLIGIVYGERCP